MRRLFTGLMLMGFAAHGQVRITQPAQLGASVVTTPAIAPGAVTADKLGPGVVPGLVWGSVTGTLANQTDLWAVLSGKAKSDGSNAGGTWPIGISGNASTVTNGVVTTGSYANPAWLTSVAASKLTGTVPNANGGAGSTTGILKAASGVVSAAVAGTDYLTPTGSGTGLSGVALLGGANTFTGLQTVTAPNTDNRTYSLDIGPSILRVRNDGKVAIGGVSDAGMDVSGNFFSAGNLVATGLTGYAQSVATGITFSGNVTSVRGFSGLNLKTTSGTAVTIDTSNNVGIGTTSPTYSLHVAPSSGDTAGQTAFFKGSSKTGVVVKAGGSEGGTDYMLSVLTNSGGLLLGTSPTQVVLGAPLFATSTASATTSVAGNVPLTVNNSNAAPTANLQRWQANSATVSHISKGGAFVSDDATIGIVLKSPSAHYWRITVGDTGTLTTTDLGTTAP